MEKSQQEGVATQALDIQLQLIKDNDKHWQLLWLPTMHVQII